MTKYGELYRLGYKTAGQMLQYANSAMLVGHYAAPNVHYASLESTTMIEIFSRYYYLGAGQEGYEFGQRIIGTDEIFVVSYNSYLAYEFNTTPTLLNYTHVEWGIA